MNHQDTPGPRPDASSSDPAGPVFGAELGASGSAPFGAMEPTPETSTRDSGAASGTKPRKKTRRGGRRRSRAKEEASEKEADAPAEPERGEKSSKKKATRKQSKRTNESQAEASSEEKPKRKTRRGGRGRRGKKEAAEKHAASPEEDVTEAAAADERKRRRRGTRGGRRRSKRGSEGDSDAVTVDIIPGEDDDLPELPELPDDAEIVEKPKAKKARKKKATRKKKGREKAETDDDDVEEEEPEERTGLILVNATGHEEQRVAVIEDGQIHDFDMTVETKQSHVGDIYRGRVVNLEPAIGAAFVDFGRGRNGFLHTSDVLSAYGEKEWSLEKLLTTRIDPEEWDEESSQPSVAEEVADDDEFEDEEESGSKRKASKKKAKKKTSRKAAGGRKSKFRARPRLPITDLLKKGQQVVVQVTKDAIGDKGPTLTTYISIPGRYLVLMPSMARRGVSRKIDDDKERRRLKRIVDALKAPDDMGVIVRTAGIGRTKAALKRDLEYLLGVWETFGRRLRIGSGPSPLYQESDVAIRTMRDLYSTNIDSVIVDDEKVHKSIVEFAERLMPEAVQRIKLHKGPRPLFHTHSVEQDYEKIFSRRVDLPSGGSIVLDQTEALVAIDVNSGRTRTDGFDFEAIALKTNLEAVPEIARQIRLRDLGGIIVVDFIDMMKRPNMRTVERAFRDALSMDRARSKLGRISQFGLLEMTRQRLGPGLDKKVFATCPRCRGTSRIRTVESRAAAILRRLGSALTLKGFTRVEVRAHPEVVEYLKKDCKKDLDALKARSQRELELVPVPDQAEDSVLRYLRADGREVRPGGRRKR